RLADVLVDRHDHRVSTAASTGGARLSPMGKSHVEYYSGVLPRDRAIRSAEMGGAHEADRDRSQPHPQPQVLRVPVVADHQPEVVQDDDDDAREHEAEDGGSVPSGARLGLAFRRRLVATPFRLRLRHAPDDTRRAQVGRSFSDASSASSTASRENGSGWYSPLDHSGTKSRKCGEAGWPDCPTVCVP